MIVLDKEVLLAQIEELTQTLLLRSEKIGSAKIGWQLPLYDASGYKLRRNHLGLFEGQTGVVLFLAESMNLSDNPQILQIVRQSIEGLFLRAEQEPSGHYGFLYGNMGLVYTLIRYTEITKDRRYIETAIEIATKSLKFLSSPDINNSFFSGRTGALFVLGKLFELTNNPEILSLIETSIDLILNDIILLDKGVAWDYQYSQIKCPVGVGNGGAGIGQILTELSLLLDRKGLQIITRSGVEYENLRWSKNLKHWPDFSLPVDSAIQDAKLYSFLLQKKLEVFKKPLHGLGWRNGVLGIALSRLRIFELTKEKIYYENYLSALQEVIANLDHQTFDCLENFTPLYTLYCKSKKYIPGDTETMNLLENKMNSFIQYSLSSTPAEISTLTSLSRLGLFLVKLVDNEKPTIYCPTLVKDVKEESSFQAKNAAPKTNFKLENTYTNTTILKNKFYRTLLLMRELFPIVYGKIMDSKYSSSQELFYSFKSKVEELISIHDLKANSLGEIWKIEHSAFCLFNSIESVPLLYTRNLHNQKIASSLLSLEEDEILQKEYILDPELILLKNKWNWEEFPHQIEENPSALSNFMEGKMGEFYLILKKTHENIGIEAVYLNLFTELLVNFQDKLSGEELFQELGNHLTIKSDNSFEILKEEVIKLIITSIQNGILTPHVETC